MCCECASGCFANYRCVTVYSAGWDTERKYTLVQFCITLTPTCRSLDIHDIIAPLLLFYAYLYYFDFVDKNVVTL